MKTFQVFTPNQLWVEKINKKNCSGSKRKIKRHIEIYNIFFSGVLNARSAEEAFDVRVKGVKCTSAAF